MQRFIGLLMVLECGVGWADATALASDPASSFACRRRTPCSVVARQASDVFKLALGKDPKASCERFEYWKAQQKHAQLLLKVCNDGYGAAGVGTDSVEVDGVTLTHQRSGGSAWRWSRQTKVKLDPIRVTEESWNGRWTVGPNAEQGNWSWERFAGEVEWSAPLCQRPKAAPKRHAYALIPEVVVTGTWASGGWRALSPGRCALEVDGSTSGYTLAGSKGSRGDARLRVLASGTVLFIEVEDDRFVGPGADWKVDDHLEVWTSAQTPSYEQQCLDAKSVQTKQWAIRIADGKVFGGPDGTAPVEGLHVEREIVPPTQVRFKVRLPRDTKRLTVVYNDSDDAKRIERRIATSRLAADDPFSLGRTQIVPLDRAVCELDRTALTPRLPGPSAARQPVIAD